MMARLSTDSIVRDVILAWDVAVMPAKGLLAKASRKRYGRRPDLRPAAWRAVFSKIAPYAKPDIFILSDENPHYPKIIQEILPKARHETVKSRRACTVGQGELKLGGRDPLFWLNHTAAMIRDNIKRLTRRTWCTSKNPQRLNDHLAVYVAFHNFFLLQSDSGKSPPIKAYAAAAQQLIGSSV